MAPASSHGRPSRPSALIWLGGGAAAVWIPLILADSLPWASTAIVPASLVAPAAEPSDASLTQPKPQPLVAPLAQAPAPFVARPKPLLHSKRPAASPIAPLPLQRQRVETAKPDQTRATPTLAPTSTRQHSLPGSVLLGGPLTLASLHEKPMVPAARIEQALRARSADRLAAVPLHWRSTMEDLIQGQERVLPTEVVHLPVPPLMKSEAYPMVVKADGVAETPVVLSELSRQALERWAERQSPTPQGSVRPVMVVLEPLAAEPLPSRRSADD